MFSIVGILVSNYLNYKGRKYGHDNFTNMTKITVIMMDKFIPHIVLSVENDSWRLIVEHSYNVDNSWMLKLCLLLCISDVHFLLETAVA